MHYVSKTIASRLSNGLSRGVNIVPGMSSFFLKQLRRYAVSHTLTKNKMQRLAFGVRLIIRSRGREIISTPSGLLFNAFDQSQYVNQILLLKGPEQDYCWEPNGSKLLTDLINKDDRVVVAGANIGFEAVLIGDCVRNGKGLCYAFEPISVNFRILMENIHLNNLEKKIKPLNLALSDLDTTTNMMAAGPNSSLLFLDSGTAQEKVTVRSLDSLFREGLIDPISAMIADVEGFELEMIFGARQLIKESPVRFIMFEVNGKTEEICPGKTTHLFTHLANSGFEFYAIPDDYRGYQKPNNEIRKLIRIHDLHSPFVIPDRWFNVLAIKPEILPELLKFVTVK